MKTRIISSAIIATLLISTTAIAQPKQRMQQGNQDGADRRAMMMKKHQTMQKGERQAFFTEEQKETMKKIHLETAKQVKPLKNELGELAAHQKTLTTSDNADLKAINKNIDKIAEAKAEVAKILAAQHQEIRSLLTEEQLLKFDSRKEQRGNAMKKIMKKGGQNKFRGGA